jgi:predicted nucleotidyltransferase
MGKRTVEDPVIKRFSKLAKSKFRIEKALLFGSRALGDHFKHSDYDVLLVSPDFEGKPFPRRAVGVLDACDVRFALELICYTPSEFEKRKNQICIVREAVRTGIEI